MKITIDVLDQEYVLDLLVDSSTKSQYKIWSGTLKGMANEVWLRIYEADGIVKEIVKSKTVTTHPQILIERFQDALQTWSGGNLSEFEGLEDEDGDELEPSPYDPNKIKVRRDILSIREVYSMMEEDKSIDLNPEFQRYFVWDNTQKSQFIESLLLGLPIPLFYFAENKDLTFSVVDGLQRLTTIKQFMNNEFPIKGLKRLGAEFNGKYFQSDEKKGIAENKSIPAPMKRRIIGTQIVINVIEASSPIQAKIDIFQRINSGGKHLNNQEVRNCLATPNTRRFLYEMVRNEIFTSTTGNSVSDRRMDDQELAMRFVGFYLVRQGKLEYSGNMKSFLDSLIDTINKLKQPELEEILKKFRASLNKCNLLFGPYAFRKCRLPDLQPGAKRQGINKSLFTVWTVILSQFNEIGHFEENEFAYMQAQEFERNKEFFECVTNKTNDRIVLNKVFEIVDEFAHKLIQTVPA